MSSISDQKITPDEPSNPDADKVSSSGSILVNSRQRGNPVLKNIRNVTWEFVDDISPDFQLGQSCIALFLSVRYHTLQPSYIHDRLKAIGTGHRKVWG